MQIDIIDYRKLNINLVSLGKDKQNSKSPVIPCMHTVVMAGHTGWTKVQPRLRLTSLKRGFYFPTRLLKIIKEDQHNER